MFANFSQIVTATEFLKSVLSFWR